MTQQAVETLLGPLNPILEKYAPETLFLQGDPGLLRSGLRVCIIGTRTPTSQGIRNAEAFAEYLVQNRVTVVSGLALGIDTVAHRTAIKHGGRTIAVLGTPLDKVSPLRNTALQQEIGAHHLLVSQFPPGCPVYPSNFPRRNRTMALLSNATIIIQAGPTSGTKHQGYEALRLGRPLFILNNVIEGGVTWAEKMLDYGAVVVEQPTDLDEALPLHLDPSSDKQTF